jgi:membrane fusion protein, copper/silver efflux system
VISLMGYKKIILLSLALVLATGLVTFALRPVSSQHEGLTQPAEDPSARQARRPATEVDHSAHEAVASNPQGQAAPAEGYATVEIDPARVQSMGIKTEKLAVRTFTRTLRTVGTVEIDETRVSHVQAKFEGWIEDLHVDYIGKPVKAGQPLYSVYSPELVAAQEEYLLALEGLETDRSGPMAAETAAWSKSLVEAARRRLARWDVPDEEIEHLGHTRTTHRAVTINSPVDGIVMKKTAVKGMNVMPGMDMFEIADLSRVWIQADVYEQDIPFVRVGQSAGLTLEALPGRTLTGRVEFVAPALDPTTRTAKVRLEFDNAKELLKPGMYTTVEIGFSMGRGLALPEEALIDTGRQKIVFVALGAGRFEPRAVTLGSKVDRFYQVVSGLAAGEEVATSAQFLLDSESRLKASGSAAAGHSH